MTTPNGEIHYHQHEHQTSQDNEGHQYANSQYQQRQMNAAQSTPSVPKGTSMNQSSGGIQTTHSFHSVSSIDSSTEMSKYFPDAQTPSLSPYRHQQETEGQTQSAVTPSTVASANTNTVNAGPYVSVPTSITTQRLPQPVRPPNMAQQQQQQQQSVRQQGPTQRPSGIPSYSSQIEGLSVSQAVVNDVLVDLQTKVINETLHQYNDETSSGTYLEPLSPIYIRAPQPTIILQSDLRRLRAELGNRVRPPVIYRHPAGANQFSQPRFQSNTFQAPTFPTPPQQYVQPQYYGAYQNPAYATSDEYKTTTTGDEYRKENEERLCNQADSTMLNDDNINDNVHTVFDPQGLSTASFNRHASPYQSSTSFCNLEDQQQGNEETILTSSNNINKEEGDLTENMFSGPARPKQEVTFDLNNCILRCFEAHRQRVARRRAARQARRTRRHKQHGQQQQQQQYQPAYYGDQYQSSTAQPICPSFGTIEQTQWTNQPLTTLNFTDIVPEQANKFELIHSSQGAFVPIEKHDYTNLMQTTSVPTDIQPSTANYYQLNTSNIQEPYIHSNVYDYTSHQAVPSTTDFIQQQLIEQRPDQTYFDYTNQIQQLTSDYYHQQQQIPTQHIQSQDTYVQPSENFEYTTGSTQTQVPTYDYQNINQQSFEYAYPSGNTQQQQQPSFDYAALGSTAYTSSETGYTYPTVDQTSAQYPYNIGNIDQQQSFDYTTTTTTAPMSIPTTQVQGTYGQPTGTFEYTRESYQTQEPIYDYQGFEQQAAGYSYNLENIEKQDTFKYVSDTSTAYAVPEVDIQKTDQIQKVDEASQAYNSSTYYQEQPTSISTSQVYDSQALGEAAPTGTIEYTRQEYFSQEPFSDSYTTEAFIEQREQQEKTESLTVNDYIKQFESKSYPQETRGPTGSSEDHQSTSTISTAPFTTQPTVDTQSAQESPQKYDLQNYTNEVVVPEPSHTPPPASTVLEEDQQRLLQASTTGEQVQESEQEIEIAASTDNTYSSLPPPPSEEIDYQQESIATNASDFPAPPISEHHEDQFIEQQQQSHVTTTIIPSSDQTSTSNTRETVQQTYVPSPDVESNDDMLEDEEIFDLQQCIAKCYAKYQDFWNKEEQRKYQEQIGGPQQLLSDSNVQYEQQTVTAQLAPSNEQLAQQSNPLLYINCGHQDLPRQYLNRTEIHYVDAWTQTPSLDIVSQSNVLQHTYDQTPSTFDTKPYISPVPMQELTTDSRGQQTIEYSPPLITQTRHILPSAPLYRPVPCYEYSKHEQSQPQKQQQTIYDHTLPLPPHLSFNDTLYQPNFDFSSQIIDQPRHFEKIPCDKHEEQQQQQRHRAHSEPASIHQESITNIPPIQPIVTETIEQQPHRSVSIPMLYQQEQEQQPRTRLPSVRLIDNGRAYETDSVLRRRVPRIDPKTGLCLVPCPETQKYAHLPPNLRPELFCIELPPVSSLPPPPPPQPSVQQHPWCVKCCCVPGRSLIKKVVYRQVEEEQQQQQESHLDYASVIDQMATTISVRYGNSIMEEGDPCISDNYHEQLRVIDFPVYVSGEHDSNLTPLVPAN